MKLTDRLERDLPKLVGDSPDPDDHLSPTLFRATKRRMLTRIGLVTAASAFLLGTAILLPAFQRLLDGERIVTTRPGPIETPKQGESPCRAENIKLVRPGWEGAMSSMTGLWRFMNQGTGYCQLGGRFPTRLLDTQGRSLPVDQGEQPLLAVIIGPGESAYARFSWSNWCGPNPGPITVEMEFPSGGGKLTVASESAGTPPCMIEGRGSGMSFEGFERNENV